MTNNIIVKQVSDTQRIIRDLRVTSFLGLTGTPSTFSGNSLKFLRLNSTETELEFVDQDTADDKVKVSSNDTTTGYIEDKIVATSNKIALTTNNDGGNETFGIDVTESNIDLNNCDNTTSNFLQDGASPTFAGLIVDTDTIVVDSTNDRVGFGILTPSVKHHVYKSWSPTAGVTTVSRVDSIINPDTNSISVGQINYVQNTGSNAGSAGHLIGSLNWTEDTVNGQFTLYGAEGRVDGWANNSYVGLFGLGRFKGSDTTYTGIASGVMGRVEIFQTDDSTPLNQGTAISFWAPAITGGSIKYSFFGENIIQTSDDIVSKKTSAQGYVYSYSPTGEYARLYHNDGEGGLDAAYIESSKNHVVFKPAAGGFLVMDANASGLLPLSNTQTVGTSTFPWGSMYFAGSTSGYTQLLSSAIAGTSVLTLPAATDTLIGRDTTDTLTNKTINGSNNTISNVSLSTGVTGNLPVGNLNSGTNASSSTFWRGDGTWSTPAGAGDVSKVGTPVDNQVGVWTGDGTIEGTTGFTYDGSNLLLTGDIGSTGSKITKGWFTDLEVTNAISGSITGNAATVTGFTPASGSLTLSGADAITITSTAATSITLPTSGTLLANIVEDTTPQLGGTLDAQDNNITGLGSVGFTQELDNGSKTTDFSIDFGTDQKQKVTLTANTITATLDTTFDRVGNYVLKVVNGGLATLTWASETGSILWVGGTAPTLTSSGTDIISFYYDGTNWYGVASLDFS